MSHKEARYCCSKFMCISSTNTSNVIGRDNWCAVYNIVHVLDVLSRALCVAMKLLLKFFTEASGVRSGKTLRCYAEKLTALPLPLHICKKERGFPSRSENFERCSKERRSAHLMLWLMVRMVAQQARGSRTFRRRTFRRRTFRRRTYRRRTIRRIDISPLWHFAVRTPRRKDTSP